jgi:cohesin complex subunit SA-1/2
VAKQILEVAADYAIAEIYAHGARLEDVAAQWVVRFNEHEAKAVAELVNFVLRASGCHTQIDEDDVADPDNCVHRLGEIQDDYQQVSQTVWPNNIY